MFEKLDSRVNDIQTEFIQQASGWSARRLSTVELFVLNMDFWNGREHDQDEAAHVVRKQPIIGISYRGRMRPMSSVLQSSGVLAQLSEYLLNPTSTEGAAIYLVLIVGIGVAGEKFWERRNTDDEPEVDFTDLLDEETLEQGQAEGQLLDDISESHKTVTAPAAIEWDTRAAHVGEQ